MEWFQPSTDSVSMSQADASLQPMEDHGTMDDKKPPEVPLSSPQDKPAPPPEMAPGNRPAVDRKVAALLAKARNQLAGYRLMTPVGDNSYETYQQIVALDPSSQAAESVADKIIAAYRRLALGAIAKGRLQQGLRYVGTGLRVRPDDPTLLALRSELRTAITEKIRIENEQARLAEQQARRRAAQQASIDEKRKAEEKLAQRRMQQVEHARREKQNAQQAVEEQKKIETEIDLPKDTEKEADRQSRLFGTF